MDTAAARNAECKSPTDQAGGRSASCSTSGARPSTVLACALVVLAAATVAGCGGGSSPTGPTATTATTPAAAAPSVTSVSPATGSTAGGDVVTITGSGFQSGATVTIGGRATGVTVAGANSLSATTVAQAAGAADVVVTNPNGLSGRLAAGFTYACPLAAPPGIRTSGLSTSAGLLLFVAWDAVANATSYVFEMGTAPGATSFSRDVSLNASGDGGGSILVGGTTGPNAFTFASRTSYFVRARARNACGVGPASRELQRDN